MQVGMMGQSCGFPLLNLVSLLMILSFFSQEPGEIEEDFAHVDTKKLITRFFTSRNPRPPCIPKSVGFRGLPDPPSLPAWLTEQDVSFYGDKFSQKGFTGGLNYYRALNL